MLRKYLVLALVFLMVGTANVGTMLALTPNAKQDSTAETVKASVSKIGVGEKARVKVTLRNNTELTGYISEARDADFTVTNVKTKNTVSVPYADVAKIKKTGLSFAAKIGIGVGIGVAVYVVVIAVVTKGFQKTGN